MSKYRPNFEKMFRNEEKYGLPRRWDGKDFCQTIYTFFKAYKEDIAQYFPDMLPDVKTITQNIYTAVVKSFQGLPQDAYIYLEKAMDILQKTPLLVDDKEYDRLKLYRVTDAGDTAQPDRTRIFHVPFHLRTKMSTQRFSIPGFPCLYLGSNLALCCEEIGKGRSCPSLIAAQFELEKYYVPLKLKKNNKGIFDDNKIIIYDISISPYRLFPDGTESEMDINEITYMRWYPLIASCSFIRAKKGDPYAPEYVIPQLFMQWIHKAHHDSVVGVRYFSCSSVRASKMGENYAFPTNGVPYRVRETVKSYDARLANRFKLSAPRFLNEYNTYQECEKWLAGSEKRRIEENATKQIASKHEIPEGETEIGYAVFANCHSLTDITIPDSVISIGNYAFHGCSRLTSISLPDGISSIGDRAFSKCENLKSINIPNGITSIGHQAFAGCENLTEIVLPASLISLGKTPFEDCNHIHITVAKGNPVFFCKNNCLIDRKRNQVISASDLTQTSLIIPEGITSIDIQAFEGYRNLVSIHIPKSVSSIGSAAFALCSGLESIDIPDDVTLIDGWAFHACRNLTSVHLPDGITFIDDAAFLSCSNLTSINIPDSVKYIGESAFEGCTRLPEDVKQKIWKISPDAFG